MRINKDKGIGTVIFIVEGQKFELSLLKVIFVDVLKYEYCSKKRGKKNYYQKGKNPRSKVFVVNTSSSNLSSIEDVDFIDNLYVEIQEQYEIKVDDAAIFYLFDRDPESNTESKKYYEFHGKYIDPWENPDNLNGGQLLLSYPSFESYEISCFYDDTYTLRYGLGKYLKNMVSEEENRKIYQLNKIGEKEIEHATIEFFKYIRENNLKVELDNLNLLPKQIYEQQERFYQQNNSTYKLLSLLTIAFLQLGIIEMEAEFKNIFLPAQY